MGNDNSSADSPQEQSADKKPGKKFNPEIFDEFGKAKSSDGKVKSTDWILSIEYKDNIGTIKKLGKRKMRPNVETKALDIFTLDDDDNAEFSISRWNNEKIKTYKAKDDSKRKLRVSILVTESSTNNIHKLILHCKEKIEADFWVDQLE